MSEATRSNGDLALLTAASDDPGVDLEEMLGMLADQLAGALPGSVGLTMTVVLDGVAVTLTAGDSDLLVTSNALLNLPLCMSTQNDPHTMVVFYAAQVGAFADLAAVLTRSAGGDESIVQSRSAHSLGVVGLTEFSARNEAIGVLVEQGHTAEEARIEIHRGATRNARTLNETAQDILDSLPEAAASTRISPLGVTGLTATGKRIPTLNPAVMHVRAEQNSHRGQARCTQQGRHSRYQPQLEHPGRTMNGGRTAADAERDKITDIWTLVGGGKLSSVLICDDRPPVLQAMSDLLRPLPGLNRILCVTEGFELLDTYTSTEADLVLIGIHQASTSGAEAASLLLALHPTAVVVVFGPVTESGTLAAAYTRGARGLLLWDPDQPSAGRPIT